MSPKTKTNISTPPIKDKNPQLRVQSPLTEDDIDDLVDTWHAGGTGMPLHEFLGLTREEYAHWVEQPDAPHPTLYERTHIRPLKTRPLRDVNRAVDLLKSLTDRTASSSNPDTCRGRETCHALCSELSQSQPAVSHHLALLRHRGIVAARRRGQHNYYELTELGEGLVRVVKSLIG